MSEKCRGAAPRSPSPSKRTSATVASETAETASAAEEEPPPLLLLLPDESAEAKAAAKGEMPVMGSGTIAACSAAAMVAAVAASGAATNTSKRAAPMPALPAAAARVVIGMPGTAGVGGTYALRSDSEYQSKRRDMRGAAFAGAAGLIDMGCARPEPPAREKVKPPLLRSRR